MAKKKLKEKLQLINPNAAGIDVGSESHYVAIPEGRDSVALMRFGAFTPDLYALSDWLKKCKIDTVVMESTGVYWIPLYQILETRGFEVLLVNARHVKNVPGRKTDIKDCQWLQRLHSYGLLSGSFRPKDEICVLRSYIRQRENLIKSATSHVHRMQKALNQMNIKLEKVISDITGFSGIRIIKAILNGERDTMKLAQLKHAKVRSSDEKVAKALEGDYRQEHLFSLKQELDIYEYYYKKIIECDKEIEKYLLKFDAKIEESKIPESTHFHKPKKNEPTFDLKTHLIRITGVDLTKINGINPATAQTVIAEIGLDMSRWKTENHFASWLGLCPNNKITGERIISSKSRKVVNRAATAFRLAARSAGLSHSALGAYYRRIRGRQGGPIAVTATAHKIAKIFYRMLKFGKNFIEIGMDYYEKQYKLRVFNNLQKRAKKLGYMIIPNAEGTTMIPSPA